MYKRRPLWNLILIYFIDKWHHFKRSVLKVREIAAPLEQYSADTIQVAIIYLAEDSASSA